VSLAVDDVLKRCVLDRPLENPNATGFSDDPDVTRHRPFENSTYV
jgi:hypothetical protein